MCTGIETKISLSILVSGIIGHFDRPGVTVVGKAMFPIFEGYTAAYDMVHRNSFTTQLKAILVAITGSTACCQGPIAMSNTIFKGNRPNRSCFWFGVQIP